MNVAEDSELAVVQRELAEFADDPLGFVMCAYPWGQGELADEAGPRTHQVRFLSQIGEHLRNPETRYKPFRKAISLRPRHRQIDRALLGLALGAFNLRRHEGDRHGRHRRPAEDENPARGREVVSPGGERRDVRSERDLGEGPRSSGHETQWRIDFNTWSEENPQASAGAHNKGKRLVIIYDEASGIPDIIWTTQEGALTDANTEIIWIAFSQCTRSDGYFYECTHGTQRDRWRAKSSTRAKSKARTSKKSTRPSRSTASTPITCACVTAACFRWQAKANSSTSRW
jgi:hypothetical protein